MNDQRLQLPNFSASTTAVLWDAADAGVLVAADRDSLKTYHYQPTAINGASVVLVGETPLPSGFTPITVYNGLVTCQGGSGRLEHLTLQTHELLAKADQHRQGGVAEGGMALLEQNVKLGRLKEAHDVAVAVNTRECWLKLASAAMEALDIELAARVYRQLGRTCRHQMENRRNTLSRFRLKQRSKGEGGGGGAELL